MRRLPTVLSALALFAGVVVLPPAVAGATYPACTITGTDGDDVLEGTPGRDVICGLAGHDVIRGLQGNDLLFGGDGDDHMFGGSGRDELHGENGFDMIRGDDGADIGYGGPDGDYFRATKGSRAGVVGDGPDVMIGGPGPDSAEYQLRTTGVSVTLDGMANDGAPGEGDSVGRLVYGVSDIEHITTGSGSDVIVGDDQGNFLISRGGADQVRGLGGGDTIDTQDRAGDDWIRAGSGPDRCVVDRGDDRTSCDAVSFPP